MSKKKGGVTPTDYLAYYKFRNNANDETGNYNGTIDGATFVNDRGGTPNSAAAFGVGTTDAINLPSNLRDELTSTFSISAWVKRNQNGVNGRQFFGGRSAGTPTSAGGVNLLFAFSSDNNYPVLTLYDSVNRIDIGTSSIDVDSEWHHYTFQYNSVTGLAEIYIDGNLGYSDNIGSIIIDWGTKAIGFGEQNGRLANGEYLDDFFIFNRILDEGEILALSAMTA